MVLVAVVAMVGGGVEGGGWFDQSHHSWRDWSTELEKNCTHLETESAQRRANSRTYCMSNFCYTIKVADHPGVSLSLFDRAQKRIFVLKRRLT